MSNTTIDITSGYCEQLAMTAKEASRKVATLPGRVRDAALTRLAKSLRDDAGVLLEANAKDIVAAPQFGLSAAQIDRLRLDAKRLGEMATAVEEIIALPDPVGRIMESNIRPNGLEVQKVRVPLGVVFFIYESRPNVTTDAAALCLKSGNAVILRGGKEARHSNLAIVKLVRKCLTEEGVPAAAVSMVEIPDRSAVSTLLKLNKFIDVAIPRGGEELIRRVARDATMPVIKHFQGICHVYVDATADVDMAVAITVNSKCHRPGVCNSAETLLVDRTAAEIALPKIGRALIEKGVELRGCPETCRLVKGAKEAEETDYGFEFLDLIMAVKVVDGIEGAIGHIAQHSSGHTETIVTRDLASARRFVAAVDSSAVMVNASTRFNDGGQFGLGAEIGISTDKFHARGPCGLNELTSYKYVVYGEGQVRS